MLSGESPISAEPATALRLHDAAAMPKYLSPHHREVVALELIYLAAIEVIVNRASD